MKDFSEALKALPESPGIYLMYDSSGEIIYVGKAISLRRRVRSYFQPGNSGKTPKVLAMVEHVDHFEYILVDNEVEALILESNFIKEHAPKYNILLRDDKQYPYICIPDEKFPRLLKVRQAKTGGGKYFGPYPNAYAVNDTIALLQEIYRLRTCSLDFDKGQRLDRPCLNYYIDRCPAPCIGIADENAYMDGMDQVEQFLKGKDRTVRRMLEDEMKKAASELKYERAARFRDELKNLDALMAKQEVSVAGAQDADIIAVARGTGAVTVQVFFFRGGKVVDREHFLMQEEYSEELPEILSSFLKQFYLDSSYIPSEVLVEAEPEDRDAIEEFLSQKKGRRVRLHVPKRGTKSRMLETVRANAEEQLEKQVKRRERRERSADAGVRMLEEALGLSEIGRVEAYDVSNTSGVQNVGSMVVYERERKVPKEYRKFRIKTVDGIDEYASQREMLSRRFDRAISERGEGERLGFASLPSVILMDGGIGQVHVCEEVLRERGLSIPVAGLVKDDRHKTRAIWYRGGEIPLDPRGALYKYLYAIQEEVHRFAINYHRQLREKEMTKSELDEIPGIGPKRRKALLKAFGSAESVRAASVDELAEVEGMNRRAAEAVSEYFAKRGGNQKKEAPNGE